mmetsp:Transcript_55464/g.140564  ORF Transcript_55464/g.140564 Transcript_55464/m.140564 type:complete len:361 (+) Transcript_55464:109-1191(+)|eukprot:CAMPEP_0183396956 /NCGR_PEP_ID=MMETSP0370-20130417/10281_1 /TAXON_ID=268820 /ORGANISM="Peridinium aciculiferum, Strain PAER-2" /LENGTH=360 /DNA_ID=CAMNT_0025577771 /DNA_START=104 /DNA_END=1186 /DNA_ORIENTATION=+
MGLPAELLQYAENLYRRFPEEFIALGMPGLEQVFDLRPDGTRTRCMSESCTEKSIEIKIRRWPATLFWPTCHIAAAAGGQTASVGAAALGAPGACPSMHPSQGPLAAWSMQEPQPPPQGRTDMVLERLEIALAALRPRIEQALLQQHHLEGGRAIAMAVAAGTALAVGGVQADRGEDMDADLDLSPTSPLRTRRRMPQINIVAPTHVGHGPASQAADITSDVKLSGMDTNQEKDPQLHPQVFAKSISDAKPEAEAAVAKSAPTLPQLAPCIEEALQSALVARRHGGGGGPLKGRADTVDVLPQMHSQVQGGVKQEVKQSPKARFSPETVPRMSVITVRVAPSALDPASPRSPGKYSSWTT